MMSKNKANRGIGSKMTNDRYKKGNKHQKDQGVDSATATALSHLRTTGTTAGTKNSGILHFLSKSQIEQRDMDDFIKNTRKQQQD
jgi:hypothetical protein